MTERTKPPTTTANRVARASTKKRRKPFALFVIPVVLVVLGVGLLMFLGGGTDAIPIIGGGSDNSVPPFDFKEKKAVGIATTEESDKEAIAAQAAQVGAEVTPTIDDLFTNAFLDPSNWRDGDYEEIFDSFSPSAVPSAQAQVETITLGAAAGDTFDSVAPDKGSLEYRVLFDQDGNPDTVVARYKFYATAERKDGTYLTIVSHGQLFLQDLDGWKITAFSFIRADTEAEPPAPTGASGGSGTTGASGASGTSAGTGTS